MPALSYPTQADIDQWNVRERGMRDGTSPTEAFEVNNSSAERTFLVLWAHREDFVKWMLGYAITWDNAGVTTLSRLLPRPHPNYPDLVATKVTRIKGLKWNGDLISVDDTPDPTTYRGDSAANHGHPEYRYTDEQINDWVDAEITVYYEHAPYDRLEDADIVASTDEINRFVIRGEVTPSAEYLQLPGAVFKYIRPSGSANPHGVAVPFNSGKILPQERFSLTWHRLPENVWTPTSGLYELIYAPAGSDIPYLGTVNAATFYGRPPGTVLFSGLRPILNKSPLGSGWEWDLEYTFDFNPNGWLNSYYFGTGAHTGDNGFYFVGKDTTYYTAATVPDNYAVYNARNLNQLFSVAN